MATLHLICGLPASGKTTYAQPLAADTRAVVFSLDRWLITLFGRYNLDLIGHEEHTRRVLACRDLIWEAAAPLLVCGTDVIFDDGFFLREHRVRFQNLARQIGSDTTVHFLDVPVATIRQRLERRNAALPAFNFHIDPETLIGFVGLFERPNDTDAADVRLICDQRPSFMQ